MPYAFFLLFSAMPLSLDEIPAFEIPQAMPLPYFVSYLQNEGDAKGKTHKLKISAARADMNYKDLAEVSVLEKLKRKLVGIAIIVVIVLSVILGIFLKGYTDAKKKYETVISELEAESQAICPGNSCTSFTSWISFVARAVPQTPRPFGIRIQAVFPWKGPKSK